MKTIIPNFRPGTFGFIDSTPEQAGLTPHIASIPTPQLASPATPGLFEDPESMYMNRRAPFYHRDCGLANECAPNDLHIWLTFLLNWKTNPTNDRRRV